jgi:hypothetical protein
MKKDHLNKQERKALKQQRQVRQNARGKQWNDNQPVFKIIY